MAIHKSEAIILKTMPFRSSSIIVTFFTEEFGKVKGIVKGVHLPGERRAADFELFTHTEIIFYEKKRSDLHLISESSIIESHEEIRSKLEHIALASYFCELINELTESHDPHKEIFELLKIAFRYLSIIPSQRLSLIFEMKLLKEMGWMPHLDDCLNCGANLIESGYFSSRVGSVLCEKCRVKDHSSKSISTLVLEGMRFYSRQDLSNCLKFTCSHSIEIEIKKLISEFLQYRIGKPLQTRKFLDSIRPVLSA